MGLKKYIGFSLLLIIAISLYVYSVESGSYEITILDYTMQLPTVLWIIIPVALLFFFSVLHLIFYGSLNFFKTRGFIKDEENIVELIKASLLEKEEKKKFKTQAFKNLASILRQLKFDTKDTTFTSKDEELNNIVSLIKDIKDGKYVTDKNFRLDEKSSLGKKNLINKVNEQIDFAVDILKKQEQYDKEVVKAAFFNVLENKSMTTVKKVYTNVELTKDMALKLFLKDVDNTDFGLTKEEILKITKELNYTKEEFITLAKLYKNTLNPDKLLDLFETLSNENEEAAGAYFYVLLELEMIENLNDLLAGYKDDEFKAYRALLDLKQAGKHYSIDDITTI
ncbi:hypothetical protein CP965_12265 [Halarcobacter mediterraneus]|uniref:Uroporphyrinogen III synthase HEM4 n=1 Tax=Halarcobacter mediterraneus TaxID=2023153 RepID=A0A4Q1ASA5_9BACT|nr:hypothetical protein [Halarcobacter mediterraneus]RXK11945.1 hypothetical protein CP965_12265 [Halarcobacter mediterraneus]